ncbi:hypothetical protein POM88_037112 [Heracleum sosnowskyi]|uniref:Histidine kinase domain-containing protein n=1 Tax=Heracleum sosnowskyi TaxID=360622 RepID=A0AAD8HRZ7_9APIA|nr:hypothetical protein POM88_037112 [Heracleum sosnowskyi]
MGNLRILSEAEVESATGLAGKSVVLGPTGDFHFSFSYRSLGPIAGKARLQNLGMKKDVDVLLDLYDASVKRCQNKSSKSIICSHISNIIGEAIDAWHDLKHRGKRFLAICRCTEHTGERIARFDRVRGDHKKLGRILSNLVNNAFKFTSEGYVSIRAYARKPSS